MKKQLKLFVISIGVIVLLSACQGDTKQTTQEKNNPGPHKVVVEEIIQTTSYTYLRVKEEKNSYWAAVSKRQIKAGQTYYYNNGLEMKNFESKELQRTFETLYLIYDFRDQPLLSTNKKPSSSPHEKKSSIEKKEISIEPVTGGISIAELFSNRNLYANKTVKTVKIKGQVVKFNSLIMGKNWVHLQDGTDDSGNFDLTITTNDEVKVGDVVTFEGKITLNKDFGAGYSYEVIMEEAKLQNK